MRGGWKGHGNFIENDALMLFTLRFSGQVHPAILRRATRADLDRVPHHGRKYTMLFITVALDPKLISCSPFSTISESSSFPLLPSQRSLRQKPLQACSRSAQHCQTFDCFSRKGLLSIAQVWRFSLPMQTAQEGCSWTVSDPVFCFQSRIKSDDLRFVEWPPSCVVKRIPLPTSSRFDNTCLVSQLSTPPPVPSSFVDTPTSENHLSSTRSLEQMSMFNLMLSLPSLCSSDTWTTSTSDGRSLILLECWITPWRR